MSPTPVPASTPAPTARWAWAWARPSPPPSPSPTGRSSTSRATRRSEQGGVLGDRGFASGSRPPNALRGFLPRQFFQPPPDRARCHPGRHCHRGDPSITRGECRRRRDQTTTAFVEKRRHRRKPLTNGFDIDHHHNIWYEKAVVNPYITLSKVDSVISGRALSVSRRASAVGAFAEILKVGVPG